MSRYILGLLTLLMLFAPNAFGAVAFDCSTNDCGFDGGVPFKNLSVGIVDGISTPDQTARIFEKARARGILKFLRDDAQRFVEEIQPISLRVAPGESITVLAAADEIRTSPVRLGQLVRFAPHRNLHDRPRPGDPYWLAVGCVAFLCGAADSECKLGFRAGIYRLSDGAELDSSGTRVVPNGVHIDPISFRPKISG